MTIASVSSHIIRDEIQPFISYSSVFCRTAEFRLQDWDGFLRDGSYSVSLISQRRTFDRAAFNQARQWKVKLKLPDYRGIKIIATTMNRIVREGDDPLP